MRLGEGGGVQAGFPFRWQAVRGANPGRGGNPVKGPPQGHPLGVKWGGWGEVARRGAVPGCEILGVVGSLEEADTLEADAIKQIPGGLRLNTSWRPQAEHSGFPRWTAAICALGVVRW